MSDDLYALGVTLLGLFRGQTPLSEYDDRQILEAKLAKGSFTILTGGHWMPQELAEAIRGLLRDDPAERWDLVQAEAWLTGRRRHPVVHQKEVRVELPFRFKGVMHYSPRTLAVALNENWKTGAVDVARSGKLQIWATRGLQDQPTAEALGEVGQSKIGPRVVDDDLLLARTLIALDPPPRRSAMPVSPSCLTGSRRPLPWRARTNWRRGPWSRSFRASCRPIGGGCRRIAKTRFRGPGTAS